MRTLRFVAPRLNSQLERLQTAFHCKTAHARHAQRNGVHHFGARSAAEEGVTPHWVRRMHDPPGWNPESWGKQPAASNNLLQPRAVK